MSSNHCRTLKFPDTNYSDTQTLRYRRRHTCTQLHNPQRVLRGKHMLKHYGGKWIHPPPPSYMHLTSHTWAIQVGRLIFAFKSGSNSWLGVDCSLVQCQRQSLWTTSPPAPERISQTSPRPVWFCTSFTSWDIPLQATNPIKTLHRNSMCDRDKEKRDRQRDIARVITSFVLEDVALSVAAKKKKISFCFYFKAKLVIQNRDKVHLPACEQRVSKSAYLLCVYQESRTARLSVLVLLTLSRRHLHMHSTSSRAESLSFKWCLFPQSNNSVWLKSFQKFLLPERPVQFRQNKKNKSPYKAKSTGKRHNLLTLNFWPGGGQ